MKKKRCPHCNGRLVLQPSMLRGDELFFQEAKCKRCKKLTRVREERRFIKWHK